MDIINNIITYLLNHTGDGESHMSKVNRRRGNDRRSPFGYRAMLKLGRRLGSGEQYYFGADDADKVLFP